MKRETFKEMGKYLLDISKIVLALVMIPPFLKHESVSFIAISIFIGLFLVGVCLTNKGVKDE